jgi:tetratricopeptide (TPR) repeat protein
MDAFLGISGLAMIKETRAEGRYDGSRAFRMIWPFKRNAVGRPANSGLDALLRRGNEHRQAGREVDAEECFREAVQVQPEHPEARRLLAQLLAARALANQERGDLEAAIENYQESLALDDAQAPAFNNLGKIYRARRLPEAAAAAFRDAVAADGGFAEAHLNLGMALRDAGDHGAAMTSFRIALELEPSNALVSLSIGHLLDLQGDVAGAIEFFRRAIAIAPDYAEAHFNHALLLLLLGEYEKGWKEYEWRLRVPNFDQIWPEAAGVRWDGSPLGGKVILLFAEQGFGDVIQFIRYAPLVAARGGNVIVRCLPKLKALLEGAPGVSAVHTTEEPLPAFEVYAFLMSLPHIFETTLDTVPAREPYLRPDAEKARRWKTRLAADGATLKVGLYWSTESNIRISSLRSLTFDQLAPLGAVPGVTYYSLQRGAAAAQAAQPPPGMKFVDLSAELGDFADDAALMSNLDLVISINTAAAHLGGALGTPVWTLIQYPPDWRWLLGRDNSPWYPSMRLYRREREDDWEQVVARVAEALLPLAERRAAQGLATPM